MIGRIRGVLAERSGDLVIVDCGGVGYEVRVSGHTLSRLPADGEHVVLRTFFHTNPQDMKMTLFGFDSLEERELFDLLITVKKVGPTAAMSILSSGIAPPDIVRLISAGDGVALQKVKGVGKKTAELIIVELREKCTAMLMRWGAENRDIGDVGAAASVASGTIDRPARDPLVEDVVMALVQMGWRSAEADKAAELLEPTPDATIESLLRQALQVMPR